MIDSSEASYAVDPENRLPPLSCGGLAEGGRLFGVCNCRVSHTHYGLAGTKEAKLVLLFFFLFFYSIYIFQKVKKADISYSHPWI